MSPATQAFSKKNLYHSDIVKASDGDGLGVMLVSEPRASKYPGKPEYVRLMVFGDTTEYALNIENDGVRDALRNVPLKTWVTFKAAGFAESAYLIVEDANGNPVLPGTPPAEMQPSKLPQDGPPPVQWGNDAPAEAPQPRYQNAPTPTTAGVPTVDRAVAMTIQAVKGLEAAGIRMDSDAAARVYSTHFINVSNGR